MGGRTGNTSKRLKMAAYSEDFLNKDDFEDFLAIFCCYDHCVNASEAVEKIATNQKDYNKSSVRVILL